ncbi:MAG TPA: phosphate ABC transporter, permease protein PstA, partial [Arcobacter skirrowii]|nr:phosphate ABC transporter, permease protein PstA [Aliarcobacter skirrowii]
MKRKKRNKQYNPFYDPTLKSRHKSAKRFKKFTLTSLIFSIAFLAFFLFDMIAKGVPAFNVAYIKTEVTFNQKTLEDTRLAVSRDYRTLVSRAWLRDIPKLLEKNPEYLNTTQTLWVLANSQVDQYLKEHHNT